jgi:hypothetical protein
VLFESIIISQLSDANTRNRALERHEHGTFADDLAEFADAVEREARLRKMEKKKRRAAAETPTEPEHDGKPKFDRATGEWFDPETGEVIAYVQYEIKTSTKEV